MTQPTQAQIEAALVAYNRIDPDKTLRGAITRALTAAAQVGEPEPLVKGFYTRKYMDEEIAATIERCAQVVKAYQKSTGALPGSTIHTLCEDVFAAIRKLKDAP